MTRKPMGLRRCPGPSRSPACSHPSVLRYGLGCEGTYVERLEELAPALEGARPAKGPTVVCLRTSREANLSMPPALLMRFVEMYQGPTG